MRTTVLIDHAKVTVSDVPTADNGDGVAVRKGIEQPCLDVRMRMHMRKLESRFPRRDVFERYPEPYKTVGRTHRQNRGTGACRSMAIPR